MARRKADRYRKVRRVLANELPLLQASVEHADKYRMKGEVREAYLRAWRDRMEDRVTVAKRKVADGRS